MLAAQRRMPADDPGVTARLSRLRIARFKSFADPVEIDVLPGLTGVVGPNGCGLRGRAIAYGFLSRRFSLVMTDFGGSDQVWVGLRVRPGPKFTPTGPYAIALGCAVRALDNRQALAKWTAGPLFGRVSTAGRIGDMRLHRDAVRRILAYSYGLERESVERLSARALPIGFIAGASGSGVRDKDIMRHTRHCVLRIRRGRVQRASIVDDGPARALDPRRVSA